jgi:hypothetical protein
MVVTVTVLKLASPRNLRQIVTVFYCLVHNYRLQNHVRKKTCLNNIIKEIFFFFLALQIVTVFFCLVDKYRLQNHVRI